MAAPKFFLPWTRSPGGWTYKTARRLKPLVRASWLSILRHGTVPPPALARTVRPSDCAPELTEARGFKPKHGCGPRGKGGEGSGRGCDSGVGALFGRDFSDVVVPSSLRRRSL